MSLQSPSEVVEPTISLKEKVKVDRKPSSIKNPHIVTLFNKLINEWITGGFYDCHEYQKKLSTKNGSATVIREIQFKLKAFLNLKTKWIPESMLEDHLWGVQIEPYDESNKDDTLRWFPLEREREAMIIAEVFKNKEVKECILTKNEECDFVARFTTVSYNEAVSAILLEAIAPGAFEVVLIK